MGDVLNSQKAGQQLLTLSKRKRMLIAAALAVGCLLSGVFLKRIFGAGPALYLSLSPSFVFVLPLALRPVWVAKFERKEEAGLEKWRPHPGQWLP